MKNIKTKTSATISTNNGGTIGMQDVLEFLKKKVQFYDRHSEHGVTADSEDLFQDIVIKVWNNIEKYDSGKAKLTTWLNAIADNAIRDTYKRYNKNSTIFSHPTDDTSIDSDMNNRPDSRSADWDVVGKEDINRIMNAIGSLNENYQYILSLHMKTGMKPQKMAEIIGCSADVVATTLCRARKALKMRLGLVA